MDVNERFKVLLRWWLFFSIVCLGSIALLWSGMIYAISRADVTKISFLIYAVFAVFTLRTGMETYRLSNMEQMTSQHMALFYKNTETGWFVSDMLLTLGMIGTVAGFIYMLGTTFSDMNFKDLSSMQHVLTKLGSGMSTALYTTAAGLVCSLLLKLQLYNLTSSLDYISEMSRIKR